MWSLWWELGETFQDFFAGQDTLCSLIIFRGTIKSSAWKLGLEPHAMSCLVIKSLIMNVLILECWPWLQSQIDIFQSMNNFILIYVIYCYEYLSSQPWQLRASCLTLEIKESGVWILSDENRQVKRPAQQLLGVKLRTPLAWAANALPLSHDSLATCTILYMYCTGGTECLSCTPGSHSVFVIRTPLRVDQKFLFIRREPMLSGLLTLNAKCSEHFASH